MPVCFDKKKGIFHLTNGSVSYMISLGAGLYPLHLYWGTSLRNAEDDLIARLAGRNAAEFSLHETPLDRLPQECPVSGTGDFREGMLYIRREDGTTALDLRFESFRIQEGKPELRGLPSARGENAETLILTLKDPENGIEADLLYTVWPDTDVIARSAVIRNGGTETVFTERDRDPGWRMQTVLILLCAEMVFLGVYSVSVMEVLNKLAAGM